MRSEARKAVASWRQNLSSTASRTLKLRLPKSARLAGAYSLVLTAQAGSQTISQTIRPTFESSPTKVKA